MALSKSQKSNKVKKLAAELETSTSAIIGTFTGLTASKVSALASVDRLGPVRNRYAKSSTPSRNRGR